MSRLVQGVVRRRGSIWFAECVEYPVAVESARLQEAMDGLEAAIQRYLEDRGAWVAGEVSLLLSVSFGGATAPEF